jgi:hypothetical protein
MTQGSLLRPAIGCHRKHWKALCRQGLGQDPQKESDMLSDLLARIFVLCFLLVYGLFVVAFLQWTGAHLAAFSSPASLSNSARGRAGNFTPRPDSQAAPRSARPTVCRSGAAGERQVQAPTYATVQVPQAKPAVVFEPIILSLRLSRDRAIAPLSRTRTAWRPHASAFPNCQ